MGYEGGFGLTWKITVSGTLTTVPGLVDMPFPAVEQELADITTHDATSGYTVVLPTGRLKTDEIEAELVWDDAQATHTLLATLNTSGASNIMSVTDGGAGETLTFAAYVGMIDRTSAQDDARKAVVKIRPTGTIAFS